MRRRVSMLGIVVLGALVGLLAFPSMIDGGARDAAERRRAAEAPDVLDHGVVQIQGRARTFSYYTPSGLASPSAVVLAFHGGGGTGARLRGFVGASLERLADRFSLLVVYPDGFEGHWNGCRGAARFSANARAVDDVGFARALLDRLAARHRLDRSQVFAIGFSNGGHLVYRLALEVPGEVRAVAVFAASLPEERGIDCRPTGRPIPVMLVNGTHDRISPYAGGEVIAPGGESLGRVRSALETARYFARLAGHDETPVRETLVDPRSPDDTWVQETTWRGPGLAEVRLYTVHGGGHTIPGPQATFPPVLGSTERRFDAVDAAVSFFLWRPRHAESASGAGAAPPGLARDPRSSADKPLDGRGADGGGEQSYGHPAGAGGGRRPNADTRRCDMAEKRMVEAVKNNVVSGIRGTGEIVNAVVATVSGTLVTTIKGTGAVGTALTGTVSDILRGAIRGTQEVGGDVGAAAKGGVLGVIRGAQEVGVGALDAVTTSARAAVQSTAEVGGDVGAAAKGAILGVVGGTKEIGVGALDAINAGAGAVVKSVSDVGGDVGTAAKNAVEGAIAGARDLGLSAEEAASAAATGALKAAGEISSSAAAEVRKVATGTIAGVKVVVREPFR